MNLVMGRVIPAAGHDLSFDELIANAAKCGGKIIIIDPPKVFKANEPLPPIRSEEDIGKIILDFCEHVDEQSDILQTVLHYTTLKRDGKIYNGHCPLPFGKHKTADSLKVYPDKGIFWCDDCCARGNAIHFIKYAEGVDYVDAVKIQAKRLGIPLPKDVIL